MAEARRLAAEYRRVTGKTLPLSGEIAVNDAIRLLQLELPVTSADGCDAIRRQGEQLQKLQVKARVMFEEHKSGYRLGQLKLDRPWDALLLVLLDDQYEPVEIYEADRASIERVMAGKDKNKRGSMTVAQFKIIGRRVWTSGESSPGLERQVAS